MPFVVNTPSGQDVKREISNMTRAAALIRLHHAYLYVWGRCSQAKGADYAALCQAEQVFLKAQRRAISKRSLDALIDSQVAELNRKEPPCNT